MEAVGVVSRPFHYYEPDLTVVKTNISIYKTVTITKPTRNKRATSKEYVSLGGRVPVRCWYWSGFLARSIIQRDYFHVILDESYPGTGLCHGGSPGAVGPVESVMGSRPVRPGSYEVFAGGFYYG